MLTKKPRTHWIIQYQNCSIQYTYFKPLIIKYILKRWQDSWDHQMHNLLHGLHSIVGKTPCSYGKNPKEQVVLTICRRRNRRLTHSYILNNGERQEGFPCNSNYSLKHVFLIECVDVSDVRQTFYNVNNLTDLFTNVDTILSFRKTD
jgi:hypothetical protein